LVKQRQYNLVSKSLVNAVGGTGHKTVIGGRYNGSSIINSTRCDFLLARVYSEALSDINVAIRYAKASQGASADYTTNMAEEWDASNARGTSLPATVNAANNGTIVGGAIVRL